MIALMGRLSLREKALTIIAAISVAWFALGMAVKPALAAYSIRRDAISHLESEKQRINEAITRSERDGKRIQEERALNADLRERLARLQERLKSTASMNGGGLDFLQSIINSSSHITAEMRIDSEPANKSKIGATEAIPAVGGEDLTLVKSRVNLRLETGFRQIAIIVNRLEMSQSPIVMRRLDIRVESPGIDLIKAEIEMDIFSL